MTHSTTPKSTHITMKLSIFSLYKSNGKKLQVCMQKKKKKKKNS